LRRGEPALVESAVTIRQPRGLGIRCSCTKDKTPGQKSDDKEHDEDDRPFQKGADAAHTKKPG